MAFSATDWRNRLSFYTNGNNSDWSFGYLGNQQGNLKYYTAGALVGSNGGRLDYMSCHGAGNTPVVEAFYAEANWAIWANGSTYEYNGFFNTPYFNSYSGAPNSAGTWYFYTGQSGFSSNTQYVTLPSPFSFSYAFTIGSDYYEGYYNINYFLQGMSNGFAHSPSTFYNYKNGPFLSYYQYSLSSGNSPFTNFPYQTITVNAAC
jgi:hypothetical protein